MRAVLDPNIIISALLSPRGAPARVFKAWLAGVYDVVVSPFLLDELERALGYDKLRERITPSEVEELLVLLRTEAQSLGDPPDPPTVRSPDPGDDYLIALASASRSLLVSGDGDLLGLRPSVPAYSALAFLSLLEEQEMS